MNPMYEYQLGLVPNFNTFEICWHFWFFHIIFWRFEIIIISSIVIMNIRVFPQNIQKQIQTLVCMLGDVKFRDLSVFKFLHFLSTYSSVWVLKDRQIMNGPASLFLKDNYFISNVSICHMCHAKLQFSIIKRDW